MKPWYKWLSKSFRSKSTVQRLWSNRKVREKTLCWNSSRQVYLLSQALSSSSTAWLGKFTINILELLILRFSNNVPFVYVNVAISHKVLKNAKKIITRGRFSFSMSCIVLQTKILGLRSCVLQINTAID